MEDHVGGQAVPRPGPGPASRNARLLEGPEEVVRQEAVEDGVGATVDITEDDEDLHDRGRGNSLATIWQ